MPRITDRSSLASRIEKTTRKASDYLNQAIWDREDGKKASHVKNNAAAMATFDKRDKMRDNAAIAKKAAETRKRNGALGAGVSHVHKSRG